MKRNNKCTINSYIFLFFAIILIFVSIIFTMNGKNTSYNTCTNNCQCNKCLGNNLTTTIQTTTHLAEPPNYPPKNQDILHNSYSEPLRDDRIYNYNNFPGSFKIPINIPTQSQPDTNYRQIGVLTRVSSSNADKETILPLMGRPLMTNRDKWNFYTMNDKNNMIKLPIVHKNQRGTREQGVDNLYEGDVVDVLGYTDKFKVTVYDNNVMRYIPYL